MLKNEQKIELISEFPELADENIILPKELYAHFGLVFFKFSLVEASLINILILHHLGSMHANGSINNQKRWEKEHDFGYEKARKQTFGNLGLELINH